MDLEKLKKDAVVAANKAIENVVRPAVEVKVKELIEKEADRILNEMLTKFLDAIPGNIDNAIVEPKRVQHVAWAKSELLRMADKISDKV